MYSLSIITDNSQTKYFFFSDVQLEDVTCGLCLRQLLLRLQSGKSATKGENDHLHDYIKDCIGTEDTCDGDVLVESYFSQNHESLLNSLAQASVSSRRLIF